MTFHCVDCNLDKPIQTDGGTGYATFMDGDKVCYACVAVRDRAAMIEHGRSSALPLYLTRKSIHKPNDGTWAERRGYWPCAESGCCKLSLRAAVALLAFGTSR
jgi:hypothetical protein